MHGKKIIFVALIYFMLFFASAQNYYEVPYVGIKSKLTKLAGSELTSFVKENNIPAEYISHADEKDVGGFFNDLRNLPAKLAAIYKEDVPDENGKITLTVYRAMYDFPDTTISSDKTKMNLIAEDETLHRCYGQNIYMKKQSKYKLYAGFLYFGDQMYIGIGSGRGIGCSNIQFKIDSGYIYAFEYSLRRHVSEIGLDEETYHEETSFLAYCTIYKDKIENCFNKTKLCEVEAPFPLLDKNNPFKYSIQNAFDGDPSTSYVPDSKDKPFELNIWFSDDNGITKNDTAVELAVINGYASTESLYNANNRIAVIDYGIIEKNSDHYTNISLLLNDNMLVKQYLSLSKNQKGNYLWLGITKIYSGVKYSDTCLAELNVRMKNYGWVFGDEHE